MKSKKFLLENGTLACEIAKLVDDHSLPSIRKQLGISRQDQKYYLDLLVEHGIINHPCRGHYRQSESCKKFIGELIENEGREKIRLEAMRYKFPITNGLDNLISGVTWDKINQLNTTMEYHTKFEGHTARLIVGKKKQPSLELYCNQWLGYNIHELMFDAKMQVLEVMKNIGSKYNVEYSDPKPTMEPEFAIPSPLAEAVLTKMGASQVRTPEGVFNRSKGRGADMEVHDLQYAHRIMAIPDTLDMVLDNQKKQQESMEILHAMLGIVPQDHMLEQKQVAGDFRAYG